MESHDEERLMYKNLTFGNAATAYNVKNLSTALRRMEAAASLFFTIPGPKMIWQFGEKGYDKSIFACTDNTVPQPYGTDNCKLSRKEPRWNYMQEVSRKRLFEIYAALIKLRNTQPALFNSTNFEYSLTGAVKYFKITEPNLGVLIVANFDVTQTTTLVTFQSAGTWYDYLTGETITASGAAQSLTLQPGEYHVYVSKNITNVITTPVIDITTPQHTLNTKLYPNPVTGISVLEVEIPETGKTQINLFNIAGQQTGTIFSGMMAKGKHQVSLISKINNLPAGIYLIKIQSKNQTGLAKLVIP
jgi:hypothetical protein